MQEFIHNNDSTVTACVLVVVGAVLRKIDLKRVKRGKEPIFETVLSVLNIFKK